MTSFDKIIDIGLLEEVVSEGVVIWNQTLSDLQEYWKDKAWRVFSKKRKIDGKKLTYNSKHISKFWGEKSKEAVYDVIFWNKEGVWLCCAPSQIYAKNIALNKYFKQSVQFIIQKSFIEHGYNIFNAVHIRRGQGHTGHDRKNAKIYYNSHLTQFNTSIPLYIATDESNKKWFLPFLTEFKFKKILFWEDLLQKTETLEKVKNILNLFPKRMENDIIGFLEQLLCANSKNFEGSSKSTFTFAIKTIRRNPNTLLH